MSREKKLLLDDLRIFEGLEENRGLSEEELMRKAMVINDLERTTLLEEVSWRKKLRALKAKIEGIVVKRG
jgi:hypothetical protein